MLGSLFLSLSVCFFVFLSLCLSASLYLSFSLYLSLFIFLSLSVSLSLYIYLSLFIFISLYIYPALSVKAMFLNLFLHAEPFGSPKNLVEPLCLIVCFKICISIIFLNSAEPLKDGHRTLVFHIENVKGSTEGAAHFWWDKKEDSTEFPGLP